MAVSVRNSDEVDEFSDAIGRAGGLAIPVLEVELSDVPVDGYVLVFTSAQLAEYPRVAERAILINAGRGTVLEELEKLRVLGAVDLHRYFTWRANRNKERGRGLFGLKEYATRLGSTTPGGPFVTDHYCLFETPRFTDLPGLIAGYLTEVDACATRRNPS